MSAFSNQETHGVEMLDTFMEGATQYFLQNPSVGSARVIVQMMENIRKNTEEPDMDCGGEDEDEDCDMSEVSETESQNEEDDEVEDMTGVEIQHGMGAAWIQSEELRFAENSQCPCVQSGKVRLVVSNHPGNLSKDHLGGEWCPCQGASRKWIYRDHSTMDTSRFIQCATQEAVALWRAARIVADKDGWFNLGQFDKTPEFDSMVFFGQLIHHWNIIARSDVPERAGWVFQLLPQFR